MYYMILFPYHIFSASKPMRPPNQLLDSVGMNHKTLGVGSGALDKWGGASSRIQLCGSWVCQKFEKQMKTLKISNISQVTIDITKNKIS